VIQELPGLYIVSVRTKILAQSTFQFTSGDDVLSFTIVEYDALSALEMNVDRHYCGGASFPLAHSVFYSSD
jgi:hypothetical protein